MPASANAPCAGLATGDAFRLVAAASVHDSHMCALMRERVADALPQPAIAARHQCTTPFKSIAFSLKPMRCRIAGTSEWRRVNLVPCRARGNKIKSRKPPGRSGAPGALRQGATIRQACDATVMAVIAMAILVSASLPEGQMRSLCTGRL
jgi:hypothetical protein